MYYLDEENFSLRYARLTTLSILLLNTITITTVLNCEVSLKNVLHFALINETKIRLILLHLLTTILL